MKGSASTHIFSEQGRENYSLIKKECGCSMGEKCMCKDGHRTGIVSGAGSYQLKEAERCRIMLDSAIDVGADIDIKWTAPYRERV